MEIFQKDYYQANAILNKVERMLDICEKRGQNPKFLVTVFLLKELSNYFDKVNALAKNMTNGKENVLLRSNSLNKRQKYLIGMFDSNPTEESLFSKDSIIFVGNNKIISVL